MSKRLIYSKLPAYFVSLILAFSIAGCSDKSAKHADKPSADVNVVSVKTSADKTIAPFQEKLLELSFNTASKIPAKPHIKDRSRAQEAVVKAALELSQPQKAEKFAQGIDNWRRAMAYAEIALYYTKKGDKTNAVELLRKAKQAIADDIDDKVKENINHQWRYEAALAKMAKAFNMLGLSKSANEINQKLETESQKAKLQSDIALDDPNSTFNSQKTALDSMIEVGTFDSIQSALWAYTELFDKFYTDPNRAEYIQNKIISSSEKLPPVIKIDLILALADAALANDDKSKSLEFVNQAEQITEGFQWQPQDYIPIISKIINKRFAAGDHQKAISDADKLLELYKTNEFSIVDIYRAGAIRPLGQAYYLMNEKIKSQLVYEMAVQAAVANPNSRPRAEDLSAICLSMAVVGFEPDDKLWDKMNQIYEGLNNPW